MMKGHAILRQRLQQRVQPFVCWRCQQTRSISQTFLKKKEEGRKQWAEFAKQIRDKQKQSMLTILEERGFVHAIAGERNAVDQLMTDKRIGVYVGVDPTAASLHVGHLLPFMALFWMYLHGYHVVSLLGSSTARIGDPTGRTTDRPLMSPTERKANAAAMHYQLKRLWLNVERVGNRYGYPWEKYWHRELVNNGVWWNSLPFMDVLKTLGAGLRLGSMLSRDTVKTKMESGDGMSFAEFCYPIMQSWDWWRMYDEKGIQMQIGGGDQYGNIVAGIDAVKYIAKTHADPALRQEGGVTDLTTPYGLTVPLLTTAAGAKFGKSAGNAIWLDQERTSLFDLYGFFVRTADADVDRYLKLFTFMPLADIRALMKEHKKDPSQRLPQHKLAYEFVDLIHGEAAAKSAEEQHKSLFKKQSISSLTVAAQPAPKEAERSNPLLSNQNPQTRLEGTYISRNVNQYAPISDANNSPAQHIVLPKSLIYNQPFARVLYAAGLVSSRSEGHRLTENKGAYVGMRASGKEQMSDDLSFVPAKLHDPSQTWNNVIRDEAKGGTMHNDGEEGLLILRVGKWKVRVIRVVSDEKWEQLSLPSPPGWTELKAMSAQQRAREALEKIDSVEAKKGKRKREFAAFREQQDMGREFFRDKQDHREARPDVDIAPNGSVNETDATPVKAVKLAADTEVISGVRTTANSDELIQPVDSFQPHNLRSTDGREDGLSVSNSLSARPLRRVMSPGPAEIRGAASANMMSAWKTPPVVRTSTGLGDEEVEPVEDKVKRSAALETFRAMLKPGVGEGVAPNTNARATAEKWKTLEAGKEKANEKKSDWLGMFEGGFRNAMEATPEAKKEARSRALTDRLRKNGETNRVSERAYVSQAVLDSRRASSQWGRKGKS